MAADEDDSAEAYLSNAETVDVCKGMYNGREVIPSLSPPHHLEKV
jgi:hypothetical protein